MKRDELKRRLLDRGEPCSNQAIGAIFGISGSSVSMWKDVPEFRYFELVVKRPELAEEADAIRSEQFAEYLRLRDMRRRMRLVMR